MRRLFRLTATFAILAAAACSNVGVDDPTGPRPTLQGLQSITTAGACTPKTAAEIEALIADLFFKNDWPEARVVRLEREKSYSRVADPSPGMLRAIGRRIVVHFAMGQAF